MTRTMITSVLTAALATTLVAGAVVAAPADARAARAPARPHGEHVVAVGRHSVTVALPSLPRATGYRLYVSTRRGDLTVSRLAHARHSSLDKRPRVTVTGLPFTTARYYWRVRASNRTTSRYGTRIGSVTLRPATPSAVTVTSSTAGTWLRWHASSGYQRTQVEQAGDARFVTGRRGYALRGTTGLLSPYGLTSGRTAWFRVRTLNGTTPSAWSAAVRVLVRSRAQGVRLLTYNVLTSSADGTVTSGERIAPWAQRRAGVVALIRQAAPDVLALQEGGGWVGTPQGYGGRRQVDDLLAALPGYALARTETPPSEHRYQRFGNYVLYRTAVYRELPLRGVWQLGDGRTAAYQLLQHRVSGARVLAVSAHPDFGAGRAADDRRAAETRRLLALAGAAARGAGVPVVYAGDFNSVVNRNHVYDGPGVVMRAAGIVDARAVAQRLGNDTYNSANLYQRTPPHNGQSIDYVYAPPGVTVASRSVLLGLRNGRFPGVIPSDHNPVLVTASYPY